MYRVIFALIILILLQVSAGFFGGTYITARQCEKVIMPGIKIQDMPVGGMNEKEASDFLRQNLREKNSLQLTTGEKEWSIDYSKIETNINYKEAVQKAISYKEHKSTVYKGTELLKIYYKNKNIPIDINFDYRKLLEELNKINEEYKRPPVNAEIHINNEEITVCPGKKGRNIDIPATIKNIQQERCGIKGPVEAAVNKKPPFIQKSDLQKVNGILGQCKTPVTSDSKNALHNIRTASGIIDESLLLPGETFSLNNHTGKRIKSRGYKPAPVYLNNRTIMGSGGGVCQVSTTLYNAALISGLDIVERHPHSKPVGYITPGLDATVVYNSKDLIFKNTTCAPVYITSEVENKNLTVKIWGDTSWTPYEFDINSNVNSINPETIYKKEPSLAEGERIIKNKGAPGYSTKVYRLKKDNSKVIEKELVSKDYYPPENKVILIGIPEGAEKGK